MDRQLKVLLVGDFCSPTGFARVNENLMNRLKDLGWKTFVLGINYHGDAHPLQREHMLYCASLGGDPFGVNRVADVANAVKPDVIILANDSWNVRLYTEALKFFNIKVPVVAYIPVDAPNQHRAKECNDLAMLITTTEFGAEAMRAGGYAGPVTVLPYGVDLTVYEPRDKRAARIARNFPAELLDAFVVGRADRNAPRKRYDLSTQYWADWWKAMGRPSDAYLYYHCATKDVGWDVLQLADYWGVGDRVIVTARGMNPGLMLPERELVDIYNTWDVHLSTTLGEGWGFVAHESAACGVAQLLPDYAAYGSWMKDGALLVPCLEHSAMTDAVNTIGGIASGEAVKNALTLLYRKQQVRQRYAEKALAVARRFDYNWGEIVRKLDVVLKGVVKKEAA